MALGKETLLDMYREMVLVRRFEERSGELYAKKEIGGVYLHLYNGQEAVGTGAIHALQPDDHVITAYRDHGQAISKGIDPKLVMAEMFGKATGTSGGRGGSMHIASHAHRFWGGYAIVGQHFPVAVGIGLEIRYNERDEVVLCFVGDGATNNAYFHEAMNFAQIWRTPVIFLIENNKYGMGTDLADVSGQTELHLKAVGYGMEYREPIDGMDVVAVHEAVSEAAAFARANGPILLNVVTYRFEGHGVSDRIYKTREAEMAEFLARDPLVVASRRLADEHGVDDATFDRILSEVNAIVEEAITFARESEEPGLGTLHDHLYVDADTVVEGG